MLLDGTYLINEKTTCTFGLQHTEAMGTIDFAGDYTFDSIELMLKFKCSPDQTMGLGYQFMDFNNHQGRFDDYRAHGLAVSYEVVFQQSVFSDSSSARLSNSVSSMSSRGSDAFIGAPFLLFGDIHPVGLR